MVGAHGQVKELDLTYSIDNAGGVTQFAAVVYGAEDGGCALPGAANAAKFLGITMGQQLNQNKGVSVRRRGIAPAYAAGAINRGERVQIAGATGQVQSCEATIAAGLANPAALVNVIGKAENSVVNAGDIVYVFIEPQTVALAVS